jgi:SagB-type dehydrogenase family enzyme
MRPAPNPDVGKQSTDLPLPVALASVQLSKLAASSSAPDQPFTRVLADRRSLRSYAALPGPSLARLIDLVFALRGFALADDGGVRRFRSVPSAGARHPLVPLVMVENVIGLRPGLWRADTDSDQLLLIAGTGSEPTLDTAWEAVCAAGELDKRPPAAIVLAARFDATLARYPGGASLVWRDAGVALGSLHLAATSLRLNSCILGTAGVLDPVLLTLCGLTGELVGDVGALAVGNPTHCARDTLPD